MLAFVSLFAFGGVFAEQFQLFEDYNISQTAQQLSLEDPDLYNKLNAMRREMTRSSLSFYLDKIRMKTHLQALGVDIPTVYFMDNFIDPNEKWMNVWLPLEHHGKVVRNYAARILEQIKSRRHYVAKVSHLSYGDGVVVIKDFDKNLLADYALMDGARASMPAAEVALSLANILHFPPTYQTHESWALLNVPPGLVVEERMTGPAVPGFDNDDGPAMEFKTFTIWGKAYLTIWCQAGQIHGMIFRNGTARATVAGQHVNGTGFVHTSDTEERTLPEWLDWPRIVAIAERLGAHKDMFRTDVFVGVSADGSRALDQLKYVVSEVELHSTYGLANLEQGVGRLWLQGYLDQDYVTIPNHEATPPAVHAEL